ncbi:allergen Tha p 1-like isoform X1 [Diabrotica virgifera virgifera]|uniref:Allergen Tha p 1-like isoform X1 n=1 Tax=Diabrotica virgifera virgifera TaxID=50390 RepID=A0A6P7GF92_DIAVI|nr:allergen Tha p 1-like isoform X1 [Diabrotica virgifera virgifera]
MAHLTISCLFIVLSVIGINGAVVETTTKLQGYSTKYDNFDVTKILDSTRLVRRYVDCLMDRLTCPPEGKFLKDIIPDAISNKCARCNEKQKKQAGLILSHLLLKERDLFLDLCTKYDPTGEARKANGIDEDYDEDYEDSK